MSVYQIQINDEVINEQISGILNDAINRALRRECSISTGTVAEACKEIVYSHKDEIIEKVVDRAAKEIVRKGLPKLIERMEGET